MSTNKQVLKKQTNCNVCLSNVVQHSQYSQSDLDFIQSRQYPDAHLTVPETHFFLTVGRALNYLFYLIPRLCHKKNIFLILKCILEQNIQL